MNNTYLAPLKIFSLSLALCILIPPMADRPGLQGQSNLFSRYFSDQKRTIVTVPPMDLLGSLREGRVHLTEQQAIEMALRHNLQVNIQRHVPITATWLLKESQGVYDPRGTFSFAWDRDTQPAGSALAGGDSITTIQTAYRTGYHQQFSSGTSLDLAVAGTRNRTTSFFSSLIPAIDVNFEILFRQNLLEGFGRIPSDYMVEISRIALDASHHQFQLRASLIILEVQERYWDLRLALEAIQVAEKAEEVALALLEQNQARFEVGTASRLELVQAEAEVALRQEDLIRAQFARRRIQDQLVRLISDLMDPRDFPGEILPVDPPATSLPPLESFDALMAQALEFRAEIQQAALERDQQRVELERSRNQLRPTLDLVAAYQQYGLGGTRVDRDFSAGFTNPPVVGITPGGVSDALSQLFSSDFYGYLLGLELQLPIFNTEAQARNAQAQIAYDRAGLEERDLKQMVALEIRETMSQIEMNRASLAAGSVAEKAAQERMDAEQARFEVGAGTTRELIEAQRDLLQAESIVVRAETELMKSLARLDRAVGRTFQSHNIRLSDAMAQNTN